MFATAYNIAKARRWQEMRRRIKVFTGSARLQLLRYFGDEIRAIAPLMTRSSTLDRSDIARAMEVATAYGVVLGAWLVLDPTNPDWPGRDRLFVYRHDDLINSCAALSALGFFQAELTPALIERVEEDGCQAVIPGLEKPGAPTDKLPDLLWESALESARNKKRWREMMDEGGNSPWVEPQWRAAPECWRTCVFLDAFDAVTSQCRNLPMRDGDQPAGLVSFVRVPRDDTDSLVVEWREAGWNTVSLNRGDAMQIYDLLSTTRLDQPLCVILTVPSSTGKSARYFSKTIERRRQSGLIGEMSDEQFSSIMNELLQG